jgi:prepilin-type N-terminal cleavage/methylation domain-containing protein
MYTQTRQYGFTLIEVLLVIAIMAILAAIVIVAINPAKQLGEAQNTQRRSDVRTILDAVIQYSLDHDGALPGEIAMGSSCATGGEVICKVEAACGGASLDELVTDGKYLSELPNDPTAASGAATGYHIIQSSHGRVTVCANTTYDDAVISVTK